MWGSRLLRGKRTNTASWGVHAGKCGVHRAQSRLHENTAASCTLSRDDDVTAACGFQLAVVGVYIAAVEGTVSRVCCTVQRQQSETASGDDNFISAPCCSASR